ncbi:hypothetical protein HanXRQr2_Chr11g0498871 [Helianthus annuus]|uniref:Uncharacterized protein n=1 Tax=Helianthus annuus TaxID=4232 RepID=A0A9K3HQ80_HELAN|nr:hypothetical protein HanXRQr2_Chr11g0498871 [Helianthus annuus]KAJ0875792.1 hypothetical protein HanPSC8_Chr11g0480671 [Helianthus annuus]
MWENSRPTVNQTARSTKPFSILGKTDRTHWSTFQINSTKNRVPNVKTLAISGKLSGIGKLSRSSKPEAVFGFTEVSYLVIHRRHADATEVFLTNGSVVHVNGLSRYYFAAKAILPSGYTYIGPGAGPAISKSVLIKCRTLEAISFDIKIYVYLDHNRQGLERRDES